MASEVHIFRVPPEKDGREHDWTCPKAAPLLRTGDCNCGATPPAEGKRVMTTLVQLTDVATGERWVSDTRPDPLHRDDAWTDGTGREWLISDMRHEHIERVIWFLRVRARRLKGRAIRQMWNDLKGPFAPGGDAAVDAFDHELGWLYEVDPAEWIDGTEIVRALKAELALRYEPWGVTDGR